MYVTRCLNRELGRGERKGTLGQTVTVLRKAVHTLYKFCVVVCVRACCGSSALSRLQRHLLQPFAPSGIVVAYYS
jgi:hypothetical protein